MPVRLFPDDAQGAALRETLLACNTAANMVSGAAWKHRVFRRIHLQKLVYERVKAEHGLAAQATLHVIRKVADSYTKDRRTKRTFRLDGAQAFDDRCLSWQLPAGTGVCEGTVSIWTVRGRLKGVRFRGSAQQVAALRLYRRGETDLVRRDGMWFLYATCEVPEATLLAPRGWLGVDLGIVNIATTSDGTRYSSARLTRYRQRQKRLRARLQSRGTKSAKRLLRKRSRKETRFATDVNHCISKQIVVEAERTGRGIAVEELTGIRERVRLRKPQRAALHSWSFHQLGRFIAYKAQRAGVPLVQVDPRYTSQSCADCGHRARSNRVSQSNFLCGSCGVVAHADHNAARNIAARGAASWADVDRPHAA